MRAQIHLTRLMYECKHTAPTAGPTPANRLASLLIAGWRAPGTVDDQDLHLLFARIQP
jgi:hypothetical protein